MEVRPGYKQTEVGVIPQEWNFREIGDLNPFVTSGSRGWAKYYSDRGSAFLRITNLSRTSIYIDLSDLKLVTLPPNDSEGMRTQLQDGDLLVSITADIGIIGYINSTVPKPAYINQHIALVRLDATKTDSKFLSYYLASEGPQRAYKATTDQGAKAGMSLTGVRKIKGVFPPLPEQRAIAAALSDVDALLVKLDQLITKKRDLKQATMQQLLTGQTRLPGFSGEWEMKRLGELLSYEQPTKYLVRNSEYSDSNDVPVLTAGKTFILGYTRETKDIFTALPAIIFDDFTTATKYVTFPFKAKSSAMKILKPRNPSVNLRLVYEIMQLIDFKLGDHKRYWISEYSKLEVRIPESAEQTAIATILSDMDAELANLEARRDKTRNLKQGMMQELLTGRIRLV